MKREEWKMFRSPKKYIFHFSFFSFLFLFSLTFFDYRSLTASNDDPEELTQDDADKKRDYAAEGADAYNLERAANQSLFGNVTAC